NFPCCGPPSEIRIIHEYSEQADPYDGPTFPGWSGFIQSSRVRSMYFTHSTQSLREALADLIGAEKNVAPSGSYELGYVENRTQAYAMHLETLVQLEKSYIEFDAAFRAKRAGNRTEFLARLDNSLRMFQESHRMAVAMASQYAKLVDDPSDMGVLYRINIFMIHGTDIVQDFMQNIVNFYHGKPYLNPVPMDQVFSPVPRIRYGGE
ncbi:MAG: hypothetical protein ACRDF4_12050, partial [Rhabdochlamydiaceae bacterium]